jgi:O-antigen/teichoic acid export membrane protein
LKNARKLIGFSSGMLFSNLIDYCRRRFGDIYVGRVYGAAINGLFAVAGEISIAPLTEVSMPIFRAAYSKYAEDVRANRSLGDSYVSIASLVWMITLPMAAGIAVAAPAIIRLLVGPRWQGTEPVLRWMAVGTAFTAMNAGMYYVYWALGRTQIPAATSAAGAAMVIPLTIVWSHFAGYVGVALAYACVSAVMLPINFTLLGRVAGIRFAELWHQVWRVALGAVVMSAALGLMFAGSKIDSSTTAVRVLAQEVVLGAAIYTGVVYVAWRLRARPPGPEHTVEQVAVRVLSRWTRRYAD